jgi:hypothetical protein
MEIVEALHTLDPKLATHWTGDGLPRVDVVSAIVGRTLTRSDISAEAPDFKRDTHRAHLEAQPIPGEPALEGELVERSPSWLYHSKCPTGRVFEGAAIAAAVKDGWVDSPAKLPKGATLNQ